MTRTRQDKLADEARLAAVMGHLHAMGLNNDNPRAAKFARKNGLTVDGLREAFGYRVLATLRDGPRAQALVERARQEQARRSYGPGSGKVPSLPPERVGESRQMYPGMLRTGLAPQGERYRRMDKDAQTGDLFETGGNERYRPRYPNPGPQRPGAPSIEAMRDRFNAAGDTLARYYATGQIGREPPKNPANFVQGDLLALIERGYQEHQRAREQRGQDQRDEEELRYQRAHPGEPLISLDRRDRLQKRASFASRREREKLARGIP